MERNNVTSILDHVSRTLRMQHPCLLHSWYTLKIFSWFMSYQSNFFVPATWLPDSRAFLLQRCMLVPQLGLFGALRCFFRKGISSFRKNGAGFWFKRDQRLMGHEKLLIKYNKVRGAEICIKGRITADDATHCHIGNNRIRQDQRSRNELSICLPTTDFGIDFRMVSNRESERASYPTNFFLPDTVFTNSQAFFPHRCMFFPQLELFLALQFSCFLELLLMLNGKVALYMLSKVFFKKV